MKHIMVIPDGDRRYAKKMQISKDEAYQRAGRILRKLIEWVMDDFCPRAGTAILHRKHVFWYLTFGISVKSFAIQQKCS